MMIDDWGQFEDIEHHGVDRAGLGEGHPLPLSVSTGAASADLSSVDKVNEEEEQADANGLSGFACPVDSGDQHGDWSAPLTQTSKLEPRGSDVEGCGSPASAVSEGVNSKLFSSLNQPGSVPSCPNFGSLEATCQRVLDSGLTFSEAKAQLWKLHKSGFICKKGFRFRKLWAKRYVELSGRMLKYFERKPESYSEEFVPRGLLELTQHSLVLSLRNSQKHRYAFSVVPTGYQNGRHLGVMPEEILEEGPTLPENASEDSARLSPASTSSWKGVTDSPRKNRGALYWLGFSRREENRSNDRTAVDDRFIWHFMANSEEERRDWVKALEKAISLIRRLELSPTLCGIGSVHAHYEMQEKIGVGRFGSIYRAVARRTGAEYAIKAVEKTLRLKTKESTVSLHTEIKIMRRVARHLDHRHICKLFQAYEDDSMVYMVMEKLSGGNLVDHISFCTQDFSEIHASSIIRQVASALQDIHRIGVIMCNLRLESLLFVDAESDNVKIVDFSGAILAPRNIGAHKTANIAQTQPNNRSLILKSTHFVSPQLFASGEYTRECDMWALGCLALFLLTGKILDQGIVRNAASSGSWNSIFKGFNEAVSECGQALVKKLLSSGPLALSISALLDDEWIVSPPVDAPLNLAQQNIKTMQKSRKQKFLSFRRPSVTASNLKFGNSSDLNGNDCSSCGERCENSTRKAGAISSNAISTKQEEMTKSRDSLTSSVRVTGVGNIDGNELARSLDVNSGIRSVAPLEKLFGAESNEDRQASFAPAGKFLDDLERQMRKALDREQRYDHRGLTTIENEFDRTEASFPHQARAESSIANDLTQSHLGNGKATTDLVNSPNSRSDFFENLQKLSSVVSNVQKTRVN